MPNRVPYTVKDERTILLEANMERIREVAHKAVNHHGLLLRSFVVMVMDPKDPKWRSTVLELVPDHRLDGAVVGFYPSQETIDLVANGDCTVRYITRKRPVTGCVYVIVLAGGRASVFEVWVG